MSTLSFDIALTLRARQSTWAWPTRSHPIRPKDKIELGRPAWKIEYKYLVQKIVLSFMHRKAGQVELAQIFEPN